MWRLTAVDTRPRADEVWSPPDVPAPQYHPVCRNRPQTLAPPRLPDRLVLDGGEFTAKQRIPPRSPNRNAVTERCHQIMLEKCCTTAPLHADPPTPSPIQRLTHHLPLTKPRRLDGRSSSNPTRFVTIMEGEDLFSVIVVSKCRRIQLDYHLIFAK